MAEGDNLTNAIIFCNRKRDVDVVAKSLAKHGLDAAAMHGDLDQSVRTRILTSFRDGGLKLLVASDVAARGLDIPNVSHIFNFDVPTHSEDYVHRIGRTGRAGRSGKSITICLPFEDKYLTAIEDLVKLQIPRLASPLGAGHVGQDEPAAPETRERTSRSRSRSSRSSGPTAPKPAPAAEAEAPPPRQERQERPERQTPRAQVHDRNPAQRRGQGHGHSHGPVIGMGDHMPEFLLQKLVFATDTPEAEPAEAVAVETPAPRKARAPRKPKATADN